MCSHSQVSELKGQIIGISDLIKKRPVSLTKNFDYKNGQRFHLFKYLIETDLFEVAVSSHKYYENEICSYLHGTLSLRAQHGQFILQYLISDSILALIGKEVKVINYD